MVYSRSVCPGEDGIEAPGFDVLFSFVLRLVGHCSGLIRIAQVNQVTCGQSNGRCQFDGSMSFTSFDN
jgi:hypothetical protein